MRKCKKVYFGNEKSAEYYIDKLNKTSSRKVKPVRAYLCERCLNWHLTSIISEESKQIIHKDRQIANLKAKIKHLENEVQRLTNKVKNGLSDQEAIKVFTTAC